MSKMVFLLFMQIKGQELNLMVQQIDSNFEQVWDDNGLVAMNGLDMM